MIASIDLPERVTEVGESVDGMADVAVDILQPTLRGPRQRRWLKRYPHVQQHDQTDCAAACLSMITSFYGHPVGVARLRDLAVSYSMNSLGSLSDEMRNLANELDPK